MKANSSLAILFYEDALHSSYWWVEGNEDQARQILEKLEAIQEATCKPRLWDGFPEPGLTVIDVLPRDVLQDIANGEGVDLIANEQLNDFLIAAGASAYAELLENVLVKARESLPPTSPGIDGIYADWLENLIINQSDALDTIETDRPKNAPGPIVWVDADKRRFSFMASDALFRLVLLARAAGLSTPETEEAQAFCARYGNKLDALLTVQVG